MQTRKIVALSLAAIGAPWSIVSAGAQDAAAFYQNKTITISVGAAAGGGLDTYARLISRHMPMHIKGTTIVVSNMPGAGGQIVARHLMHRAAKDGTAIGTFFPSVLIDPLINPGATALDTSKFSFIGNAKAEASVCMIRRDAAVKEASDLLTQEVTIGGTTGGSQVVDFPTVERNLLGAKLRLIAGYNGTREIGAAIERSEVQGICGVGWSTLKVQFPDILKGNPFARIFIQEDMKGDPELNAAGVPLMPSLAKSEEQRQVLAVLYAQNDLARPYVAPPETPADRVALLQQAFIAALRSPELQSDAERMRIDVATMSGEEMRNYVQRLYESPKPVLEMLKKSFGR